MKKFILVNLFLFTFCLHKINAQSHQGVAFNVGYSYINTNAGYIGGEYTYRFDPLRWHGISLGAGAYYGSFNSNFKFIPEAHATYSYFIGLGELSVSPYNINPSIGIHFINLMRLKIGYSWKLGHENVNMTGITFGINFLIGSNNFYDYFMVCPPPSYLSNPDLINNHD